MKPEDFRADAKRPLTGEEYLKSLQDGREIYIYGERVDDVEHHRATAESVQWFGPGRHHPGAFPGREHDSGQRSVRHHNCLPRLRRDETACDASHCATWCGNDPTFSSDCDSEACSKAVIA